MTHLSTKDPRLKAKTLGGLISLTFACCGIAVETGRFIEVSPVVAAVERQGITGAGRAVSTGSRGSGRIVLCYPNHPDDFGASAGTGAALSFDNGRTWSAEKDDWPLPGMADLWIDRLRDGTLIAMGIRWLPDPKRRGEITSAEVPGDAWKIAASDDGKSWNVADCTVDCPREYGVIARPLPGIFEGSDGALYMPAYAWSKTGNRSLLLRSADHGRSWVVRSVIASTSDMLKAGAPVTTPWLETTVSPTTDGSWIAVIRTGSNETAALVTARSSDEGLSWSLVGKVLAGPAQDPVTGKLPGLLLMPGGPLVLLTAHTKRGCFLHLSIDGTGREWTEGQLVTRASGGNTSMLSLEGDRLLVFTPANGRINCWTVRLLPHEPRP
jgi:hypothetical protein